MAAQDGTTFEGTFNSPSVGKFKDNTTNLIVEQFMRDLVTAIKESYLNRIDDMIDEDDMSSDSATRVPTQQSVKAYVDAVIHYRGVYDLSLAAYPSSGGSGAAGIPAAGDYWIGGNTGVFDVQGFDDPIDLFRGAMLHYIGGTVSDKNSWVVKQ